MSGPEMFVGPTVPMKGRVLAKIKGIATARATEKSFLLRQTFFNCKAKTESE